MSMLDTVGLNSASNDFANIVLESGESDEVFDVVSPSIASVRR